MVTNEMYRVATYQVYKAARYRHGVNPPMTKAAAFRYARLCVKLPPECPRTQTVRAALAEYQAVRAIGGHVRTPRELWADCYALARAGDLL